MCKIKKIKILGINFIDAEFETIKCLLDKNGGLLVLPAGPTLANINNDKKYFTAIKNSDFVLFDSGYLCILLKILKKIQVKKFSGYIFFKKLFESLKKEKKLKIFLVDPNKKQSIINKKFFIKNNIKNTIHYVAPFYKKNRIIDNELLKMIKRHKPNYIIINLAGGVQEILGYYLKKRLNHKVSIICSGAAISYFTKQQAPLNDFLDKLYLGWLLRIIFNPFVFLPRYLSALKLFFIIREIKI